MAKKPASLSKIPTQEEILSFLRSSSGKSNKRDIARAFNVKGEDRVVLKDLIRSMLKEGLLVTERESGLRTHDQLPRVCVVDVGAPDALGDITATPANWVTLENTPPPRIYFESGGKRRGAALSKGDKALVNLTQKSDEHGEYYAARLIRVIDTRSDTFLGIFNGNEKGGRILPVDKKQRFEFAVAAEHVNDATHGMLVMARATRASRGREKVYGLKNAEVIEKLDTIDNARSISLIAIHQLEIPYEFSKEALEQARKAKAAPMKNRSDLRHLSFITIDPADARDHDDAICAVPEYEGNDQSGWHIMVAIADVAYYVPVGSPIDKEALERGNSVYFPDRVVPMLPEELSTDLCSLKPNEDRAVMVAHLHVDNGGSLIKHRFERAIINSQANVAYELAHLAIVAPDEAKLDPSIQSAIDNLYGAYLSLVKARTAREPLNLEIAERKIILDDFGNVIDIVKRDRFESHMIVEEMMILANVAAAETLEKKHVPCMYRVHEEPSLEKIENLRAFLETIGLTFAKAQVLKPKLFNHLLAKVSGSEVEEIVNEIVLRSQTQAYYTPDNVGHFGLSLTRYAHFTSPIRRYSDILVHRGLITALKMGDDGLKEKDIHHLRAIGEKISKTERRAMTAERDTKDRYLAAYLTKNVGEIYTGRISGVTRFGLFVALTESGADGLIPVSSLYSDYFHFDEARHALIGERSGQAYRLGDTVKVRIIEADRFSGGLKLELVGAETPFPSARREKSRRSKHKHAKRVTTAKKNKKQKHTKKS